jgi:hypothetical protein
MTQIVTKRTRKRTVKCAYCGQRFKPPKRGRPPRYCCASHRNRAYVVRVASRLAQLHLVKEDTEDIRIRRAVIDVIRELSIDLGPPPSAPARSRFKVIKGGK